MQLLISVEIGLHDEWLSPAKGNLNIAGLAANAAFVRIKAAYPCYCVRLGVVDGDGLDCRTCSLPHDGPVLEKVLAITEEACEDALYLSPHLSKYLDEHALHDLLVQRGWARANR